MTRTFFTYLLSALLLGFMTVSFVGCGDDEDELTIKETVVKVDENGNAKGGHRFSAIDDSNFLIDGIKYTAKSGDLFVTGYDEAYFKGEAKIITALDYQGRRLEVKGIEKEAFRGCNALTAIYIPSSVTYIGGYAFYDCTGLTSVTIGSGVTSICEEAFNHCVALKDVYCLAEEVPTCDDYSFHYETLSEVTLHVPAASIDAYRLKRPWNDFGSIVAIE